MMRSEGKKQAPPPRTETSPRGCVNARAARSAESGPRTRTHARGTVPTRRQEVGNKRLLESQRREPICRFNGTTIEIPEGVFLFMETDERIPTFTRKRERLRRAGDEKVVGWGVAQSDRRNQSKPARCGGRSE